MANPPAEQDLPVLLLQEIVVLIVYTCTASECISISPYQLPATMKEFNRGEYSTSNHKSTSIHMVMVVKHGTILRRGMEVHGLICI